MKTGLIIMTALLPTIGHENLIRFADSFLGSNSSLTVMIFSRSFEPISGKQRLEWFQKHFSSSETIRFILTEIDEAPQEPEDHPDFWNWWRDTIMDRGGHQDFDYVFASEPYGLTLAEVLGAQVIPYDQDRAITPVKGSEVRRSILENWNSILHPAREDLNQLYGSFCIFGQESVGKTTISQALALRNNWEFQPEWARPYLETVGEFLTPEKMMNIFQGQMAQQTSTKGVHPIQILDTDLLSTIGYMRLKGWEVPEDWLLSFERLESTHYFVLPDDVPFERDPLRYGGNSRETDTSYWTDLLEEFGCSYTMVPRGPIEQKMNFIQGRIIKEFEIFTEPISSFLR